MGDFDVLPGCVEVEDQVFAAHHAVEVETRDIMAEYFFLLLIFAVAGCALQFVDHGWLALLIA